jgi:hypothetical protein
MHLFNITALRHRNAALDDIDNLLNPGPVASKMVQDIPITVRRPCILASSSPVFFIAPFRVPPALPTRMMRFSSALVTKIARGELAIRMQGRRRRAMRGRAPIKSEENSGYTGKQQRPGLQRRHGSDKHSGECDGQRMFQHGAKAVCARPSPLIEAERREQPSRKHLLLEYVCILQANGSCNQGKLFKCKRLHKTLPGPAAAGHLTLTGESAPTSNEVPQTRQTAQVHLHLRSPARVLLLFTHSRYAYFFPLTFFSPNRSVRDTAPLSEPRRPGCYRDRDRRVYTRTGSILCYCPCSTSPSVARIYLYMCVCVYM